MNVDPHPEEGIYLVIISENTVKVTCGIGQVARSERNTTKKSTHIIYRAIGFELL